MDNVIPTLHQNQNSKRHLNQLLRESSQSQRAKVIELNNKRLYNSPIKTESSG